MASYAEPNIVIALTIVLFWICILGLAYWIYTLQKRLTELERRLVASGTMPPAAKR